MATIADFEGWLDQAALDDHEEIYGLYCTGTLPIPKFEPSLKEALPF